MAGRRRTKEGSKERNLMLNYLRDNPQELQYLVGDYIAKHDVIKTALRELKDDLEQNAMCAIIPICGKKKKGIYCFDKEIYDKIMEKHITV